MATSTETEGVSKQPSRGTRTRASAPEQPSDRYFGWGRLGHWMGLLVLAACVTFVFVQLHPGLLFRNTTPSGGDTAAHVWWPAYLRDHLLPSGRLAGWSPDFYAGFPAGQFYFPLPALMIVALDIVAPYNVAFKLITALGPMLLPVGAYVFARGLRAPRPTPALFAVAATAFLFFTGNPGTTSIDQTIAFNQHIMGGTLASTLAGEFSFTIALAFALMFLGTFASALRTGQRLWVPAVFLAATLMSHLVVAIFVALGAGIVWLASRPIKNFGRAGGIGLVGGLLSAVWLFPLLATIGYTTDMRYGAIRDNIGEYLFPSYLFEPRGVWPWLWGGYVLIGAAVIVGVVRLRRSTMVLVAIASVCGLAFRFWESLQSTTVWNLRLLPFWYLSLFLLLAVGAAELVRGAGWLARELVRWWGEHEAEPDDEAGQEEEGWGEGTRVRPRVRPRVAGAAALSILTIVVAVGALVSIDDGKAFLPDWIAWNYRGYEDTVGNAHAGPKSYAEYRAFIDTAATLPPGRLLWEGNQQLDVYGSPLALMLLPYWTHGRITSMEGVYYEASATTPYHFIATSTLDGPGNASNAVGGVPYGTDQEFSSRGVPYLQLLGVRYLAVHSVDAKRDASADARLRLVATVPDLDGKAPSGWNIYTVLDAPVVGALAYQPVVVDQLSSSDEKACEQRLLANGVQAADLHVHTWQDCIAVPWFTDVSQLARPLVADGPASWKHLGSQAALAAAKQPLPDVKVTRIHSTDTSVSFHVSRTGVPVYVKTSWFPNWEVEGATGPYRATPNFMVVVPTSHDVTLRYGTTTAEWLGRAGTVGGFIGVGALAFWPAPLAWFRRRRRRVASRGDSAGVSPPSGDRDPEAPDPKPPDPKPDPHRGEALDDG